MVVPSRFQLIRLGRTVLAFEQRADFIEQRGCPIRFGDDDVGVLGISRKLERARPGEDLVRSIYGIGYKLEV